MAHRTPLVSRIVTGKRRAERWIPPLPHPSWSGEAALPDRAQPLAAGEFWNRLGL